MNYDEAEARLRLRYTAASFQHHFAEARSRLGGNNAAECTELAVKAVSHCDALLAFIRVRAKVQALASGEQSKGPAEGNWMCLVDDWTCDRRAVLVEAQAELDHLCEEAMK